MAFFTCNRCGFDWPQDVGCMMCEELEFEGLVRRKTETGWVLETETRTRSDFDAVARQPAEVVDLAAYRGSKSSG